MEYPDRLQNSAAGGDQDNGLFSAITFPVLMRATNGKTMAKRDQKVKISTVVQPDELDTFFAKYAELCKASMQGMKKRDKSKKKKAKRKK